MNQDDTKLKIGGQKTLGIYFVQIAIGKRHQREYGVEGREELRTNNGFCADPEI
jgi:hypothetical protein